MKKFNENGNNVAEMKNQITEWTFNGKTVELPESFKQIVNLCTQDSWYMSPEHTTMPHTLEESNFDRCWGAMNLVCFHNLMNSYLRALGNNDTAKAEKFRHEAGWLHECCMMSHEDGGIYIPQICEAIPDMFDEVANNAEGDERVIKVFLPLYACLEQIPGFRELSESSASFCFDIASDNPVCVITDCTVKNDDNAHSFTVEFTPANFGYEPEILKPYDKFIDPSWLNDIDETTRLSFTGALHYFVEYYEDYLNENGKVDKPVMGMFDLLQCWIAGDSECYDSTINGLLEKCSERSGDEVKYQSDLYDYLKSNL